MAVPGAMTTARERVKVLVIDDDEIAREFLVGILQRGGCMVSTLPSPIGATQKILQEGIQVVVLDVMMPTMNGDKLAAMLRKNAQMKDVGVVLVSSCPRHEIERLAAEAGADAFVGKEEVRTALASAVMRAVRRKSGAP